MIKNDSLKNNEYVKYTIHFGEKDRDIWDWSQSIPNGKFSMVVKDAIRAYLKKEDDYKIPIFKNSKICIKAFRKNLHVGKTDDDICVFFNNSKKGMVSHNIKEIIRYFLYNKNKFDEAPKLEITESISENDTMIHDNEEHVAKPNLNVSDIYSDEDDKEINTKEIEEEIKVEEKIEVEEKVEAEVEELSAEDVMGRNIMKIADITW